MASADYVAQLEQRIKRAETALFAVTTVRDSTPRPYLRSPPPEYDDDDDGACTYVALPASSSEALSELTSLSSSFSTGSAPLYFFGGASDIQLMPRLLHLLHLDAHSVPASGIVCASALPFAAADVASDRFHWPQPATETKLIDVYFCTFNRHYPVLNEVVFRRLVGRAKDDWKSRDAEHAMLALAVYSTATRYVAPGDGEEDDGTLDALQAQGVYWANLLYSMLDQTPTPASPSTTYLQVMLLCVYCLISAHDKGQAAWLLLGRCVRLLQSVGAHRRFSARNNGYSVATDELFRRLWWLAYLLDRMMSAHFGRPMCIDDDDVDVAEARLLDDDVLLQGGDEALQLTPCRHVGFVYVVRLARIIGRALRALYGARTRVSPEALPSFDDDLQQWLQELPAYLRYDVCAKSDDTQRLIDSARLHLVYHYARTLIHRPFIRAQQQGNDAGAATTTIHLSHTLHSLAVVSSAAQAGIQIVYDIVCRGDGVAAQLGAEVHMRTLTFAVFLVSVSLSTTSTAAALQAVVADVEKATCTLDAVQRQCPMASVHAAQLRQIVQTTVSSAAAAAASKAHSDDERAHSRRSSILTCGDTGDATSARASEHTPLLQTSVEQAPQSQFAAFMPLDVLSVFDDFSSVSDWTHLFDE